jgi:sulfur transfer complex TusBCD TusB component (DsrH family)
MEPLGAAASIITLLDLVHKITILCLNARSRIKTAMPNLIRLINEVKSLRGVLEGFIDLSSDDKFKNATHSRHLETLADPNGILKDCLSELQEFEKWLQKTLNSSGTSSFGAIKWSLKEKDVSLRLEGIARVKSILQLGLVVDHTQLLLESKAATLSLTQTVERADVENQRRTILRWLTSLAADTNTKRLIRPRARSTGDWFLQGAVFQEWKSSAHSLLWLYGIPGSGKTFLCHLVRDVLREPGSASKPPTVLQFFFDFSAHDRQDASALLCSLVLQIQEVEEGIPPVLSSLYKSCSGSQSPSESELLETLRTLLSKGNEVFFVLDGVDECGVRGRILEILQEISNWNIPQLHMLIASRRESDIERTLSKICSHTCHMDAININEDISKHVQQSIDEDSRLNRWPTEIQEEIARTIAEQSDGMFRWADCQLQAVKECKNLRKLRATLSTLPTTLEDTYARILEKIDPSYTIEAQKMLMWLCFAV